MADITREMLEHTQMLLGALRDGFMTRIVCIVIAMSSGRVRDINMPSKCYSLTFVLCLGSNTLVLNVRDIWRDCPEIYNEIVPRYMTRLSRDIWRDCPEIYDEIVPRYMTRLSRDIWRDCPDIYDEIVPRYMTRLSRDIWRIWPLGWSWRRRIYIHVFVCQHVCHQVTCWIDLIVCTTTCLYQLETCLPNIFIIQKRWLETCFHRRCRIINKFNMDSQPTISHANWKRSK